MEKRYRALRIIATIFRIFGVMVGVITILGSLLVLFSGDSYIVFGGISREAATIGRVFMALASLVGGVLSAVVVYSVGELIYLFINIEENTRFTALMLRERPGVHVPSPVPYSPPPPPPPVANYPGPDQPTMVQRSD